MADSLRKKQFQFAPGSKKNTGSHPPAGRSIIVPTLTKHDYFEKYVTNTEDPLFELERHLARKSPGPVPSNPQQIRRNNVDEILEETRTKNMPSAKFYRNSIGVGLKYGSLNALATGKKMANPAWRGYGGRKKSRRHRLTKRHRTTRRRRTL